VFVSGAAADGLFRKGRHREPGTVQSDLATLAASITGHDHHLLDQGPHCLTRRRTICRDPMRFEFSNCSRVERLVFRRNWTTLRSGAFRRRSEIAFFAFELVQALEE